MISGDGADLDPGAGAALPRHAEHRRLGPVGAVSCAADRQLRRHRVLPGGGRHPRRSSWPSRAAPGTGPSRCPAPERTDSQGLAESCAAPRRCSIGGYLAGGSEREIGFLDDQLAVARLGRGAAAARHPGLGRAAGQRGQGHLDLLPVGRQLQRGRVLHRRQGPHPGVRGRREEGPLAGGQGGRGRAQRQGLRRGHRRLVPLGRQLRGRRLLRAGDHAVTAVRS